MKIFTTQITFFTVRTHCWFMFSLSSIIKADMPFQAISTQLVLWHGIIASFTEDSVFAFGEIHDVPLLPKTLFSTVLVILLEIP